ncbi:MAG: MBL fold metallo-hydrolase [Chloroflexota bacterium]|nr:MBL fold metallo-hydrolase [Chloroflexota bacterium]MDQ5866977.1 MBL fold metallo-hydrolase [Chloroflexota bacterium]
MIEAHEVVSGVWLFQGDASGRNFLVLVGDTGAVVVDPGLPDAVNRFVAEMGGDLEAVVLTGSARSDEPVPGPTESPAAWPTLPLLSPDMFKGRTPLPISMPAWDAIPLSGTHARMALYETKERILLAGDLLPEASAGIPNLSGGIDTYLQALETVEALDARLAIPSRGAPATGKRAIKARIDNDRNYVSSLVRHVGTSAASGIPLDRLLQVAADLYDDFAHLQAHLENMRYVWNELRGGGG